MKRSARARALLSVGLAVSVVISAPILGAAGGAGRRVQGGVVDEPTVAYHPKLAPKVRKGPYRNHAVRYNGPEIKLQAIYVGREAAEPTVGVLKDGTAFYAAATFDALGGSLLARTETLRSTDGGLTWESVQPQLPAGSSDPPTTLDPYVYVEENTGRVFSIDLTVACSYLHYSDDKGDTWETNRAACGQFVNDHQTIYAGPPPEGVDTLGFKEILYYCFNRVSDSTCTRSLDGGRTFIPLSEPAYLGEDPEAGGFCGGLHGHVHTDNQGRVFVPKGHCGRPWISISEDAGVTWTRVPIAKNRRTAGIQTAVAADSDNNLYYVWWSRQRHLPYLSVSKDHGNTWSTPRMIAPPGVHEVNFPTIAAGDRGRIVIMFPGTRVDNQQDGTRPWNYYFITSTNALSQNPLFLSTTANEPSDPVHRGVCTSRCRGMFDFLDVIVSPHDGYFWGAVTDNCTDENDCNVAETGQPTDMDGIAVRQLAGPKLLKKK